MIELFRRGEVLPEGRTTEEEEKLVGMGWPDGDESATLKVSERKRTLESSVSDQGAR
jgi:hypothetical protein